MYHVDEMVALIPPRMVGQVVAAWLITGCVQASTAVTADDASFSL